MSSLTPERIAEIREEIQCSHELTGILLMDERRLLDAFDRIAELEAEVAALREDKARLLETAEELATVARWRNDNTLPSPADDPKPWTARMQTAWEAFDAAIDAARKGGAA